MSSQAENNKRIAKNTFVLYLRMLTTVGISFYTSRVILSNLGVSDYGLYNIIGGLVSMFYMVTSTLSSAISRFLTYELGQNDKDNLRITFSTSINIQLIISLFIIVCAETIGLWFVNEKLNIDPNSLYAANWVYQFTILAFVFEMISVPYNASIISHEKMKAFAYITIYSVIIKLIIAFLLIISPIDKLIFYSLLMCCMSVSTQLLFWIYCKKHFEECKYQPTINKQKFKQMFKFAGWSFFSTSTMMLCSQGVNIILNIFCGTPINAARGLALQVDASVKAFSNNFIMAFSPQITKSYAQNDKIYTKDLVYNGTKYSFLLLYIISFPIVMETNFLLKFWLDIIPPFTSEFIKLTLIYTFFDILLKPSIVLNNATGDIKKFQLITGLSQLLVLPLSYLCLYYGIPPYMVLYVRIFIDAITFIPKININNIYINQSKYSFIKEVLFKLIGVIIVTVMVCYPIIKFLEPSWLRFGIVTLSSSITIIICCFLFVLSSKEKILIKKILFKKFKFVRFKEI